MKTTYFKTIVQKTTDTHSILVTVIPNDMLCTDLPSICELQGFMVPKTVYTGTYPTLRIDTDSVLDRSDLIGQGIEGILTSEQWYSSTNVSDDVLGISL